MFFASDDLPPSRGRHIVLATPEAMTPAATIARMIAAASIDVDEFSARFGDCAPPSEAAILVRHFKNWLAKNAPDHPLRNLRIMHIHDAQIAAGLDPRGPFSPETAAYERYGNNHCPEDNEKWFAWLKGVNAVHSCNWRDAETLPHDLADAIEQGANILVLHRIS